MLTCWRIGFAGDPKAIETGLAGACALVISSGGAGGIGTAASVVDGTRVDACACSSMPRGGGSLYSGVHGAVITCAADSCTAGTRHLAPLSPQRPRHRRCAQRACCHTRAPAQMNPSPNTPGKQLHVRLPGVLKQVALAAQPPLLVAHSLMSAFASCVEQWLFKTGMLAAGLCTGVSLHAPGPTPSLTTQPRA